MEIREVEFAPTMKTRMCSHEEIVPPRLIDEAGDLIQRWATVFPREDNLAQRVASVPSLLVRLDCVWKGALHVYEIEERPSGIGATMIISPVFGERFSLIKKRWTEEGILSDVVVVKDSQDPTRMWYDDPLWTRVFGLPEAEDALRNDRFLAVLVRADPKTAEFHRLEPRSISSIAMEGMKNYGVPLGLWKKVSHEDALPWDRGFALKPLQGARCRNLVIWSPEKRLQGVSTRTKIMETVRRLGEMYLQEYIEPMPCAHPEIGEFMIFRIFFGWDPRHGFVPLGGAWNARAGRQIKLHGASDACFGALALP